jgi:hypothetical protein
MLFPLRGGIPKKYCNIKTRQRGDRRCHALAAAGVVRRRVGMLVALPIGRWLGRRRYTIIISSINLGLGGMRSGKPSSLIRAQV